ncbi:acyltransferase family protein [Quadrisphaera sp. INWT6]|uniref:acyltransferase family protein n=1 Tax=Quadrisphaera sp. INWT6 TaxID=2596917 RepID=UPI0018921766|nr:acyltransferase family protein [Quadrisphaera sp. INWT6]
MTSRPSSPAAGAPSAPPATPRGPAASTRLHGLDALRAVALGLGVVLHTLSPFLPGSTLVDVTPLESGTAESTVLVIHLFRMVLFMALAGYFGRLVLVRRGAASYVRDRAVRILLPLAALSPVVLVAIIGVEHYAAWLRGEAGSVPPLPSGVPYWLFLDPAHLWFLWVLVQVIVVVLMGRALLLATAGAERLARWGAAAGGVLSARGGVLLAAVPYLAALLLQGTARHGVHQPPDLLPDVVPLMTYLGAFLVGWFLHARSDALARLTAQWRGHLVLAVVVSAAAVALERTTSWETTPLFVHAPLVALAGWAWVLGLVGLFLQLLPRESPAVRYLADSAYWVYIAHLPLTAVVQLTLAHLAWAPLLQLLVAWAVSGVVLLLSYDLLVRGTWVGRWLNGRRYRPLLGASLGAR